jgi:hypothetical protein
MYDEMRFLFDVDPSIKNRYSVGNKVVNPNNPAQDVQVKEELDDLDGTLKLREYVINKSNTTNYIKNNINKLYNTTNSNPYIDLIKFSNEEKVAKSLHLRSSDFAYLRDIGVMPINRLMILRRFGEGITVPVDLNDLESEPISVVIGWVKKDSNFLNFSFNETWNTHTTPIHEMLAKIIKDEFGVDITAIIPIPGWGLGFLFGILNEMGLTNYNQNRLPIGDPNLLKEALTRPHESFGLESDFSFDLETVYEQKYISGIDPTVSSMEILNNLLAMGTSDTHFLGKIGSKYVEKLKKANNNPTDGAAWASLISDVVVGFVSALKRTISSSIKEFTTILNNQNPTQKPDGASVTGSTAVQRLEQQKNISGAVFDFGNRIVSSILASTIARYQWPLRGSISMFTGEATTPWHLTIGNPYAPLLSMNNIHVKNVAVTMGKDMGVNDMPRTMEVKVQMRQGRNLGKQEIFSFFGVSYKRQYSKFAASQSTTPTGAAK